MKQVLTVVVCLLLVGSALAVESAPSNKVGYVKVTCPIGYTPFGLPFTFWDVPTGNIPTYGTVSVLPSDIVGTQANCSSATRADQVWCQNTAVSAKRSPQPSCAWNGLLETDPSYGHMWAGGAYWYQNRTAATRYLVLAGEADTTAQGVQPVLIPGPTTGTTYTPYSWKDPREVHASKLNLRQDGFLGGSATTSDRVWSQGLGTSFYFLTSSSTWAGDATVRPGDSYWIQNRHLNHPWTYLYTAAGNDAVSMPGGEDMKMPTVRTDAVKMTAPATKQASPTGTKN